MGWLSNNFARRFGDYRLRTFTRTIVIGAVATLDPRNRAALPSLEATKYV